MTKVELTKLYAEATGLPATQAKDDLDKLGDIMTAELLGSGEVPLPGIGKLCVKSVAARTARNPKTGEAIVVPARKKVFLRVGKELKESLN